MPFSSGVYTLPNPALVTGEVVSATENNTTRNDIAGALNLTMLRNGTSTATANLPMGGYKLTGLGAPTTNGDALSYGAAAVVTTLTSTSLTATRVPYAGTGGLLQDASTFTFDGTTLTAGGFTTSGAISAGTITASGAITVSGGTANGVAYLNGSKVLTTGSALTFDGTALTVGGNSTAKRLYINGLTGTGLRIHDDNYAYKNGDITYESAGLTITSGDSLVFGAVGSEQMRLTSTGLGIGTSSPGAKLDINGSVIMNGVMTIKSSGTAIGYFGDVDGTTNVQLRSQNAIEFKSGGNTERMRLDSSGNLGLGVTPSAWNIGKAMQIGSTGNGFLYGSSNGATSSTIYGVNAYYNGGWKYDGSGYSTRYEQSAGSGFHAWYIAPSGTAGNAISFTQAMTLDASSNLTVGGTIQGLQVFQSSSGADLVLNANGANRDVIIKVNGSEQARFVGSTGNVGIGTSSPNAQLNLSKSASGAVGPEIRLNNDASTSGDAARISLAYSTSLRAALDMQISASGTGEFLFKSGIGTLTERMRIDSSGNLLVGQTASSYQNSNSLSFGGGAGQINHINGTASGTAYFGFGYNGSPIGSITQNGTTNVAYNTSSDYRLKENIQPMQNALATVAQLNPVTYTWKADGSDGQGFIAHELQAVVPDCVTGEKDAVDAEGNPVYQGIDTSFLVATLCKAIQELEARVKQLEGK